MISFSHLNTAEKPPKKGDLLVIETKRNKGAKVAVMVKGVVNLGDGVEIIIQTGRNKYFNWEMHRNGTSWVWRVWNLGKVTLTSGLNNQTKIDDL